MTDDTDLAAHEGLATELAEAPAAGPRVAAAAFSDLGQGHASGDPFDVRLLADIPMNVTVELGRAELRVRELLGLREGSVVSLDKAPGTAVDVVVNGRLVARGDVVVVEDDFGVRITEVIDPSAGGLV